VSTEGSTTDTARSLAGTAWLAAQGSLAGQSWHFTSATVSGPGSAKLPGTPVTVTLNVADTNLSAARIIWEALGQEPVLGGQDYTFTLGPGEGTYWVEAEAQWPDGRRAFAVSSIVVSTNAPPELSDAQRLAGGSFSFRLNGSPLATYVIQATSDLANWNSIATNTMPLNGVITFVDPQPGFARRYYRAKRAP
jgi:hypothetical protein